MSASRARRLLEDELERAVALRRRIHGDPRPSGQERETTELLLHELGLGPEDGDWVTEGFIGRLGPAEGPAVALRAELDALPIVEQTGVEWASTTEASHLCGHDVHMAALVAVVRALRAAGELPVPLVLLLQPREETLPCGAEDLVAASAFDRHGIRAAFGAHVQPKIAAGSVSVAAGAVNASADEFSIEVIGRAAHGAYPELGRDPIVAAAAIVTSLQHLVSRRADPMVPTVVTVGEIRGGSSFNAIPGTATMRGTIRTFRESARREIGEQILRVAEGIAAAHDCEAKVDVGYGEPVLDNDERLAQLAGRALEADGFELAEALRSCGADDFAFYGTKVPSLMAFVGVGDAAPGAPGLHHPAFLPDDRAVGDVARVLLACYEAAADALLGRDGADDDSEER